MSGKKKKILDECRHAPVFEAAVWVGAAFWVGAGAARGMCTLVCDFKWLRLENASPQPGKAQVKDNSRVCVRM